MQTDWVAVTERLPRMTYESADVLVCTTDRRVSDGTYVGFGRFARYDGCARGVEVTHWMPLPEPPKPQETP